MGESSSREMKLEDSEPGTSSGIKRKREESTSTLEVLPLEILLEVFKNMPLEDVIRLGNETTLLNSAARVHTKWAMMGLRRSISKTLQFLSETLKDMPMNRDHWRNEIAKSYYLTRYISTEIELLFASVWRFRDEEAAWNLLAPHLAPVVTEFEKAISAQMKIEKHKPDLTPYRIAQLLKEWYNLVDTLENGLYGTLNSAASQETPFEIQVIDMLMCAPSYSFQLALKRAAGTQTYNVYGFFKTPNLKPVGQVPNVFNSQLNVDQKKRLLLSYLREAVQRENLYFLAEFSNNIYEFELAQMNGNVSENDQLIIMSRLSEAYQKVHETPYSPVLRYSQYRIPEDLYEEYYIRCPNENLSFTGLYCIVLVPRQGIRNMPLAIPFLRGRRHKLYDNFECQELEGQVDLSNLFPHFVDCPSYTALTSSNAKPKLQLIVHYRESYVAAPSEAVVNIGYDNDGKCYITFHTIHGEPLTPTTSPIPGA